MINRKLKHDPSQPVVTLLKYTITVEPKVAGRRLHRVIQLLVTTTQLSTLESFTDFKSTLILRGNAPQRGTFDVHFFPDDVDGPNTRSPIYKVTINSTDKMEIGDLIKHIDPTNVAVDTTQETILHMLNTMLYHQSRSNSECVAVGKKTFPLSGPAVKMQDLTHGLQALRGFFASIRLGAGCVLV